MAVPETRQPTIDAGTQPTSVSVAASDQTTPILDIPNRWAKCRVQAIQDYSLLTWEAIADIFSRPRYWAETFLQMDYIGVVRSQSCC